MKHRVDEPQWLLEMPTAQLVCSNVTARGSARCLINGLVFLSRVELPGARNSKGAKVSESALFFPPWFIFWALSDESKFSALHAFRLLRCGITVSNETSQDHGFRQHPQLYTWFVDFTNQITLFWLMILLEVKCTVEWLTHVNAGTCSIILTYK